MAKMALIERELKRDKLVAKYAKKHAELKATANDAKRSDEERAAASPQCESDPSAQPLRNHRPGPRNLPPVRHRTVEDP